MIMADYITRQEAQEFIDQVNQRLDALEREIPLLRQEMGRTAEAFNLDVPVSYALTDQAEPAATAAAPERGSVTTAARTGVDYGAVAYGLASIKADIKTQFGVTDGQMASKWTGVVSYFADVFTKSDPNFDRAAFTRNAG